MQQAHQRGTGTSTLRGWKDWSLIKGGAKAATGQGAQGPGDKHQVNIVEHRGDPLRQDQLRQ